MDITCGIFFINCKNELLIGHPTGDYNQQWSIPKGIKEENESTIDAAYREFYEETNINLKTDEFLKFPMIDIGFEKYKSGKKILHAFLLISNDINHLTLNPVCNSTFKNKFGLDIPEIDKFKWISIYDEINIHETQQILLDKIKNNYKF